MKKATYITYILITLWLSLASFFSAGWTSYAYMCLSGRSEEVGASVLVGVILTLIWIAAIAPAMAWLCVSCYRLKNALVLLPPIGFVLLYALGIYAMGTGRFLHYLGA